mmetsp:Transcript_54533/g.152092  ORF Transcript_54533/g.152092 Transcript_54533/m.152092 type:complete len:238 (+) Transcript_54533:46-759(+)
MRVGLGVSQTNKAQNDERISLHRFSRGSIRRITLAVTLAVALAVTLHGRVAIVVAIVPGPRVVVVIPGRFALALPLRRFPLPLLAFRIESGHVGPLLHDLQLPPTEQGAVEQQRILHGLLVFELDVSESLRLPRKLIDHDRDAIHVPTGLEVLLHLLGGGAVVHVAHVHRATVGLFGVGAIAILLDRVCELLQLFGLLFHLLHFPLHLCDLGVRRGHVPRCGHCFLCLRHRVSRRRG